jgi:hypothetical protein
MITIIIIIIIRVTIMIIKPIIFGAGLSGVS